jgi:cation transport protein ChaC
LKDLAQDASINANGGSQEVRTAPLAALPHGGNEPVADKLSNVLWCFLESAMDKESSSPELTEELVRLVERTEPDPGPEEGTIEHSFEDFENLAEELLSDYSPDTLWVFAYGSLIWNPEFDYNQVVQATAHGWHRSFCLLLTRWRGTRELPALMLALDRGGMCNGNVYALPNQDHKAQIIRLLEREIDANPPTNVPRWIDVSADGNDLKALTFIADPEGPAYAGKLPLKKVAWTLARAAGHWGSSAQYLYNTFSMLESSGIHDESIWELQALVAKEITDLFSDDLYSRKH